MEGKVEISGRIRLILEDERVFPVEKKLRKLKRNSPDKEYWQDDFATFPSYRTRRSYAAGPFKSPAMQLNEMGKEVQYKVVSQTGPPHCPTFVVKVIVDGCAYCTGRGISKKAAKQNAAERALRHLRRYLPRSRERNQFSDSEQEDDDAPSKMISLRADKLFSVLAAKVVQFYYF